METDARTQLLLSTLQESIIKLMETKTYGTHTQLLLTSLRESIIDKPPYISGKLQLPASSFSLFYRVAEDGPAARFEDSALLGVLVTFLS